MEHRNQKEQGGNQIMSQLVKFVIPQEGDDDTSSSNNANEDTSDELAKYILDETYDLLESPSFANAERQCLDTTFDQLRMRVLGKLFLLEDRIPLANVVTHLQKNAVSTFHKPPSDHKEEMKSWGGILGMMEEPLPSVPNDYISKLERLEAVHELCDVCF
jgi:peroxin-3